MMPKKCILIADGDPRVSDLLEDLLHRADLGGDVHKVFDGTQATDFLRRVGVYVNAPRPEFVLLDLDLPEKCGREVLRAIRADPPLQRLPVVLTLRASNSDACFVGEVTEQTGFLVKPEGPDDYDEAAKVLASFLRAPS